MSDRCEFLARCGFFLNYKGNTRVIRQGRIRLFCEDVEKSERRAKKQYRKQLGEPPADNMSPTGNILLM